MSGAISNNSITSNLEQYTVNTLSEYINTIETISDRWLRESQSIGDRRLIRPWFRGHSRVDWQLIPSAYRNNWPYDREYDQLREFQLYAQMMVSHRPESDWEWYFLMQHYGIPTRLLDWTENSLIALYFAIREIYLRKVQPQCCVAVWMINPFYFNYLTIQQDRIMDANDELLNGYRPLNHNEENEENVPRHPVCIVPPAAFTRINAQRSVFTIHGFAINSNQPCAIENLRIPDQLRPNMTLLLGLVKILVPTNCMDRIIRQLYTTGVSERTVFPDLDGLGREIWLNHSGGLSIKTQL